MGSRPTPTRLVEYRRTIVEMLFLERNHVCAVCVANNHCELQDLAEELGLDHFELPVINPTVGIDASHPLFAIDHNRCIMCVRCVRVCAEIEGAFTWDVMGSGIDERVVTDMGTPWGESTTCTSCGKCVQVCPTGALFEKGRAIAEGSKARRPFLPYLRARGPGDASDDAKPTLATIWLDGCSGCHMSFLDLDERLLEIAERADIVYSPLVDAKEYPTGSTSASSRAPCRPRTTSHKIHDASASGRGRSSRSATARSPPTCRRCATRSASEPLLERAYVENVTLRPGHPARRGAGAAADGPPGPPRRRRSTCSCPAARRRPTSSTRLLVDLLEGRTPDTTRRPVRPLRNDHDAARIVIDPVTRIEGHAKITIHLDDDGEVRDAQFHVTQFRGFERIVQGRPVHEMPSIMARICGICPVSHLVASAKACDEILAVEPPPDRRRPAPGDEPRPDRAVERAELLPPLLARPAVRLRRRPGPAQPLRRRAGRTRSSPATGSACAGSASRSSSGSAASGSTRPGSCPAASTRRCRRRRATGSWPTIPEAIAAIERAIAWYTADARPVRRTRRPRSATSRPPSWGSSIRTGNVDHYDGRLRVMDADGALLADRIDPRRYTDYLGEAVEPWSFLKSTYWKALGYPDGVYRVGPLARVVVADRMGTPRADGSWAVPASGWAAFRAARSTTTTPG